MKGPSSRLIAVLRPLLRQPMKVNDLITVTRLPERTVRAQLQVLCRAEAVVIRERISTWPRHGSLAVYAPVVHQI